MRFLPKTKLGKLSVLLGIMFFILLIIGSTSINLLYSKAPVGDSIISDISGRPVLAISMLAAFTSAVLGFIVGLISIIKQKELSWLVYAAIIMGILISIFLLGEVITLD